MNINYEVTFDLHPLPKWPEHWHVINYGIRVELR